MTRVQIRLKGLRLIARTRSPTRGEVAQFIALNGGVLTKSVRSPSHTAGLYRFHYTCPKGHHVSNTVSGFRRRRWCKGCKWNRLTHADCVAFAAKHEGKCLTAYRETIIDTEEITFRCRLGHVFSRSGTSVKEGKWCRDCIRLARRVDVSRYVERAKQRGGEFLGRSDEKRCMTLRFRCSAGHHFGLLVANFNNGKWCSTCSSGLGERISREVVETLFGKPFPKLRPAWLEMRPGSYLELDGYNEELGVAFEHHGRHHYGDVQMRFPTDFRDQKRRDTFKRKRCVEQRVRLIEIPEIFGLTPLCDVKKVVLSECRRLGVRPPRERLSLEADIDRAYRTESFDDAMERLRRIIESKDGVIEACDHKATSTLSRIPVVIRCRREHPWNTTAGSVLAGHWCKKCYFADRREFFLGNLSPEEYGRRHGVATPTRTPVTIEDVRELAESLELTLLSDTYVTAKTKYQFHCNACGRRSFSCSYDNLKQKKPRSCPACSRMASGLRRRHRLEDLQKLARRNNGYLLSWQYRGVFEPLRWWCSGCEDAFVRPADPILQGTWCTTCSRRKGSKKQAVTMRAKASARRIALISRRLDKKRWALVSDLQMCITEEERVSLLCAHGLPLQRSFRYLLRERLQCECERSNSRLRGCMKLERTLKSLKWTLESEYRDGKTLVSVRCHHGQLFERVAGLIDRDSKCECEKRAKSGEKYISKRANGRFAVNVALGYKLHYLGSFSSLEEAVQVRDEFCRKHVKVL
jgi:hypothetical protein